MFHIFLDKSLVKSSSCGQILPARHNPLVLALKPEICVQSDSKLSHSEA